MRKINTVKKSRYKTVIKEFDQKPTFIKFIEIKVTKFNIVYKYI